MKTPPLAGSVLRIGVALLLCAACFQAGRWYQELSGPAAAKAKADPGEPAVARSPVEPAKIVEPAPLVAAGAPAGQSEDIITPLNVRDPSALVMGPAAAGCPPAAVSDPEPPAKEIKPRKLKEGRLLELLKKEDRKARQPRRF